MSDTAQKGDEFGRLTVIDVFWDRKAGQNRRMARCRCQCGKVKVVYEYSLRGGKTKSCGCLVRDARWGSRDNHGMTGTPEYFAYNNAKRRCAKGGAYYRERGFLYGSFEEFLADVGKRPDSRHSLERKDNTRGYEPGNCKWATAKQQARNTKRNRMLKIGFKERCVAEWCELVGVDASIVRARMARGINPVDALVASNAHNSRIEMPCQTQI